MPARRPAGHYAPEGTADTYISAEKAGLAKGSPVVPISTNVPDVSMAAAPATAPPRAGGTLLPEVAQQQALAAQQQAPQQLPGMAKGKAPINVPQTTEAMQQSARGIAQQFMGGQGPPAAPVGTQQYGTVKSGLGLGEEPPTEEQQAAQAQQAAAANDPYQQYKEEVGKGPMTDNPQDFKAQTESYMDSMTRRMKEAMYLASGQLDAAGISGTGVKTRQLQQIQSAFAYEMSATIENMLVEFYRSNKQARIQWLQASNSMLALQEQKQLNVMNMYFQGTERFAELLEAEGYGPWMGRIEEAVQACGDKGNSVMCMLGVFEGFRLDGWNELAWGEENEWEKVATAQHEKLKEDLACSCFNPLCWFVGCG